MTTKDESRAAGDRLGLWSAPALVAGSVIGTEDFVLVGAADAR